METLSPSVVLAAYAESLVDGRRVAVFGDATSPTADELLERGARLVHLYDPDAARAAEAAARNRSKQISVLPLDTADIAVRDGAFDVAVILDLTLVDDGARLLKRIRRALAPRGVAIIASPNPDAKISLLPRAAGAGGARTSISYYDLFDAVSAEFAEVRMLGQTPFVGYAVVDFSPEGEPDVSLDSGLVPGGAEEPEWFVVVASASPVEIEAFSIVQLPAARVVRTGSGGGDPRIAGELEAARANEARLVEHVSMLQAEVAERRAAGARAPSEASVERTRTLETELSKRDARVADAEARTAAAEARARGAEDELERLRQKQRNIAGADSERADLEKRAGEHRIEREGLEKRLAGQTAEKERLEKRLAEQTAEKERLEKRLVEQTAEKERFEKRLAEQTAEKERFEKRRAEQGADKERLEKLLAEQGAERERFEKRLAELGAEKERLEKRALDHLRDKERLEKLLADQVAAREGLEKRAAEHVAAREGLEKRLAARDQDLQRLTAVSTGDAPDDVSVLETALKDRGEKIRKIESDLREAERVGKELVRELGARAPTRTDAPRQAAAESRLLSTENARLKADLEAAGWTIQELEGRLLPTSLQAAAPAPR